MPSAQLSVTCALPWACPSSVGGQAQPNSNPEDAGTGRGEVPFRIADRRLPAAACTFSRIVSHIGLLHGCGPLMRRAPFVRPKKALRSRLQRTASIHCSQQSLDGIDARLHLCKDTAFAPSMSGRYSRADDAMVCFLSSRLISGPFRKHLPP